MNIFFKFANRYEKIFIIIFVVVVLSLDVAAKKIEGKFFFEDDTLKTFLFIPIDLDNGKPDYVKLQNELKYYDETTATSVYVYPEDALGFQFTYKEEEITMLSKVNTLIYDSAFNELMKSFIKIEKSGNLSLYKYFYDLNYNRNGGSLSVIAKNWGSLILNFYVFQIGNEKMKAIDSNYFTFRVEMMEYFKSCPGLRAKIDSREFSVHSMFPIVEYYNEYCK